MTNKYLLKLMVFLLGTLVFFQSCENPAAGLGKKVDIYAPALTVASPITNAYLRGVINFNGTIEEDGVLQSLTLSYPTRAGARRTVNIKPTGTTWTQGLPSGNLDPEDLAEGEDKIIVTALDASGKTTVVERVIFVDNLKPTVLITAPLSYGAAQRPQYSDYIDIKGEIYDPSPLNSVIVTLYENGSPLASKPADGTNTWSVRFLLKGSILDQSDDKNVYTYDVAVTDKAGNATTYYYHRNDLYALIAPGKLFPTIDELGILDQRGSGTAPNSGIVYSALALKRLSLDPSPVYGDFMFTFEAKADIKFTNLDKNGLQTANVLGVNAPITGLVTPPPSGGAIDLSTVSASIYTDAGHTTLATPIIKETDQDDSDNIEIVPLGDSISFVIYLRNGAVALPPGPYWMTITAGADGSDPSTQAVEFFIDSQAPTLTETTLGVGIFYRSNQITLGGSAVDGIGLDKVEIFETKNGVVNPVAVQTIPMASAKSFPWTSTPLPSVLADGVYEYEIKLTTTSSKVVTQFRSVTIDSTAPDLEVTNLSPVVGASDVNGNLIFSVAASDANGLKGLKYWLQTAATADPAIYANGGGSEWTRPYDLTIDTNTLTDNTDYEIWVIALDKAGNEKRIVQTFHVDQSTDKPVINLSNLNAALVTAGTAPGNLLETGAKVQGSITDDDSVDSGATRISIDGGAFAVVSLPGTNGKSNNFTHDLSALSEGVHYFKIESRDLASAKNGKPFASALLPSTGDIYFVVDKSPPALSITSPSNGSLQKANFTVSGTASDANNLKVGEAVVIKDGANAVVATLTTTAGAWSHSVNVAALAGLQNWTITATDSFGKTTAVPFVFTVDKTPPVVVITNPGADGAYFRGTNLNLLGTATDAFGLASIEYSTDAGATWTPTSVAGSWTVNLNLSALGDGLKTVMVRSTDLAGNTSVAVVRTIGVDNTAPTLTETTIGADGAKNALFNLGGVASDAVALASLSVTQNGTAITTNPPTLGAGTWSVTGLPRTGVGLGTSSLISNAYTYNITLTDTAGNVTIITRKISVDVTPPETLTITAPGATQVGVNAVSGVEFTFRGTSADAGQGMSKIWYIINSNPVAPAGTAGYTPVATTGNWSFSIDLDTDGPGADTGLAEGKGYYLHVKAEDLAGNVTADGNVVSRLFDIDQGNPTLTETLIGTTSLTNKKVGFSLSGVLSDTLASPAVAVSVTQNGTLVNINPPTSGAGVWSLINLPRDPVSVGTQLLSDGIFEYVITATDGVGKTTVVNRTIRFDASAPTVTLTSPASGEPISTATMTLQGAVNDGSGAGVASVEYSADNSSWFPATILGGTWSKSAYALGAEGAKTIYVRSTDLVGNVNALPVVNFYYDLAAPTLAETTIGTTAEQLTKNNVTLAGTASDGNALTSVVITATKDGADQGILHTAPTPASWTYTQTATGNDGLWVYTITATDAASRTTSVHRTVRIDTTAPVPTVTLPSAASFVSGTLYTATGAVAEANTIASVEYSTNSTNGINGTWNAATGLGSWSVSLNLATLGEGAKTLWVRATDSAGNLSSAVSRAFIVDTNAPGLTETAVGTGSVYRNALFTLSGMISDNVDLASLSVTQNKDAGGAVQVYTTSYAGANDTSSAWSVPNMPQGGAVSGQYEYIVTVVDASGKTTSLTRTVTVDSTKPDLEITSVLPILSGAKVNGRVTLSVNASDANGLTGVKYFLRSDASTPAYGDAASAPTGGTLTAPYKTQIDTTLLSNTTSYTLWVIARDKAGNDETVSTTLNVDQSSDTPTGTIDSPANTDPLGADRRIRGTFSDDDGVPLNGAVLNIRKVGAPTYTAKNISVASSAGQLVSWNVDVSSDVTSGGDGTYQIYLVVSDNGANKLGLGSVNYTGAVQTFVYDVTPPTVSTPAASPVQGAYKANDVITFAWTATDASGMGTQTVDMDGVATGLGAVTNPGGNNYQVIYTVPATGLVSGNKTLTLVSPDTTGRTSTRTVTILIDVDAPVVDNAFTVNPAFVGSTPNGAFELKGTSSDNRGLSTLEVALSNDNVTYGAYSAATLSSGNWTFNIANSAILIPTSGTLYFRVRATDQAGNVSTVRNFSQAVDQAADKPIVSLLSPVNASTYGTTVQVSGTAVDDDNLAGVSPIDANAIEIQYWGPLPDTTPTTVNPTITGTGKNANFNYSLIGLAAGNFVVKSRAKDVNGLWGDWSADIAFEVNAGAPNLTVDTVVNTFRNNANLTLTGTVADGQGVQYVKVRVNGGSWTTASAGTGSWGVSNTSDTWSIAINLGPDGVKTIEVSAADMGGFVTNQQITTTLDSTAPTGTFDAQFRDNPSGSFLNKTLLNKVVRITGTVTELNLADTNPVEISINGGAYVPVTGTYVWSYIWDTTALGNGVYTLGLRITDKAGNVTTSVTDSVTTLQSADIPVINQAFVPAGNSGLASNNILGALLKVSGTISDDDGFLSGAVNLYLDGSPTPIAATNTTGTTGTWDYTWGSLAQGEHFYSIQATDRNGGVANLGPTYFIVDTANPTLNVTAPNAAAKIKAGTLAITGTATDAGGLGALPLSITLRHSSGASSPLNNVVYTPAMVAGTFTQNVTIDGTSIDGTLFIDFVLTDRAGKQSSLTRAITIDTTPPVLNLNYPSAAAYINGLISFAGNADDLNGLSDVTLQLLAPGTYLPVASITRSGSTLSSWEFPLNAFSYATTTYGVDVNADGKLWKVLFRLAATDNSGNVQEYKINNPSQNDWPFIYIDTDGDKPTISVTQPKNGDNIGGIVNMFGTATDDDGPVMQVEVQIDFNGDGDFADSRDINNNGSTQLGVITDILGYSVKIGNPAQKWEDETAWYVVNVSNNSWTEELNALGELYSSNTGGNGNVIIRVRSRDIFGLPSEISTRTITLDETFPRIENVTPNDQTYQSGVFPFFAEYGDNIDLNLANNSVARVNINKTGYVTLASGANSAAGWSGTLTPQLGAPQHGYDLGLNIDTNHFFPGSSGIFYVDLYVKDESNYTNQRSFTYYIDNQPPTGSWSDRPGAPDGLNLRNGQVRINNNPTYDYAFLEGNYLDSGSVSGIDRVEVYFEKAGTIRRIKGATGSLAPTSTESVSLETYSEGMGTWSSAPSTLGYAKNSDPGFGDNYIIKIDKATEMSSITTGADSDGDGYFEFLGLDGGSQRFRAYFDSQYLPDGEIDIHYVVYDLAGNRLHKVRRGFIANNGPSYNRIRVGSDYNNNGTIVDVPGSVTEIQDYYYPTNSVDRLATSQPVKVKNGKIYFAVDSTDPNGTIASTVINIVSPSPGTRGILTSFGGAAGGSVANNPGSPISIVVPSAQFPTAGDYYLEVVVKDNDSITTRRNIVISVLPTTDSTNPIVTPITLTQANGIPLSGGTKLGHLELQADNSPGAWTTLSNAYGGDNDPKVSGEINLKGTITDNNLINSLNITAEGVGTDFTIANWNGTQLVSADPRLVIDSQDLTENGHTVNFTYKWNTAVVTNVAGLNKTVAFRATDGSANDSIAHSVLKFDVVPYITKIQTGLSNAFSFNWSVFNRSAKGDYPVRENETLNIYGFNLNGASTIVDVEGIINATQLLNNATFNNKSYRIKSIGTTNFTAMSAASNTVGLVFTKNNVIGSGTGTVNAVIPAVNIVPTTQIQINVNSHTKTGDLVLRVNNVISINNLNDNTLEYNQESNSINNLLLNDNRRLAIWSFNSVVTDSAVRYPTMRVSTGVGQEVGFLYDSGAQYVRMNIDGSDFQVDRSYTQWYDTSFAIDTLGRGYGSSVNGDSGGAGTQSNGGFANTKFYGWNTAAMPGTNNNTTSSAYGVGTKSVAIENSNNNVIFNSNRVQDPRLTTWLDGATARAYMSYYDSSSSQVKYRAGNLSGAANTPTFGGALVNHNNVAGGSAANYQVVADSGTTYKSGQYSAVGITNNGAVSMVAWYDSDARSLIFSYNTAPLGASTAQWQANATVIDADFAGWFVDMAVDDQNGIHLAYFNSSSGDLKYAYKSAYNAPATVVTVDSFLSVGTNISISVKTEGANRVPYISYYMGAYTSTSYSVRTAWRTNFATLENGVVNDQYTGNWESMTVPTANTPKDFRIGIGIKSNSFGVETPILGYATTTNIETAQLK